MKIEEMRRCELRRAFLDERIHQIEGVGMVCSFQMLPQALASDGETLFDYGGGFAPGESVAFNRVACVGEFDPKPLLQIADKCRRQRTTAFSPT